MEHKSLGDMLSEYMEKDGRAFVAARYFEAWPVVAGPNLSACTVLERVLPQEGKIVVKATSLSARSLLMMERKRLVRDWNKIFTEVQIKEVVVAKRT